MDHEKIEQTVIELFITRKRPHYIILAPYLELEIARAGGIIPPPKEVK